MAAVGIKWGVVGDGIAVSGVKKRRGRDDPGGKRTTKPSYVFSYEPTMFPLVVAPRQESTSRIQDTIACNGKKDEILFERGSEREGFFYFSLATID